MGDTTSDQDTFVSIDQFAVSPRLSQTSGADETVESQNSSDQDLTFSENAFIEEGMPSELHEHDSSTRPSAQSPQSQADDQSAFMWNLSAPNSGEKADRTEEFDLIPEASPEEDITVDPSDMCGEFDTALTPQQSWDMVSIPSNHEVVEIPSNIRNEEQSLKETPDYEAGAVQRNEERDNRATFSLLQQDAGSYGDNLRREESSPSESSDSYEPEREGSEYNQNVIVDAAEGLTSYEIENPFSSTTARGYSHPIISVYSTVGPLTSAEERNLKDASADNSSPYYQLLKRFVETISFQRKHIQDLKAAEIQIASSSMLLERRRYSEVEHERSEAIETLLAQLAEEAEEREKLGEENKNLKRSLSVSNEKMSEVREFFTEKDPDFTFSGGVRPALDDACDSLGANRNKKLDKVHDYEKLLDEKRVRIQQLEKVAEDNQRKAAELEHEANLLRAQVGADGKQNSQSYKTSEPSEDSRLRIRELELDLHATKSSLRSSQAEKMKIDDALLSLNVDFEDCKREVTLLTKKLISEEKKLQEQTESTALQRKRFYKFETEMSRNYADVVNEVDLKEAGIRKLQHDLNDRDESFKAQSNVILDLQTQLQTTTDLMLQRDSQPLRTNENSGHDNLGTSFILQSLRDELAKAQGLLKDRSNELERSKSTLYLKEEHLIEWERECTKLRAALAMHRKSAARLSNSPSNHLRDHQAEFLRRLSHRLGCEIEDDGSILKNLSEQIDHLTNNNRRTEEIKQSLNGEIHRKEQALHSLRMEMGAEISTLKADLRHQENIRIRAQEERGELEKRCQDLMRERRSSISDSFLDVTSTSLDGKTWSQGDGNHGSRRESMFSAIPGEDGLRWKDSLIEEAIQSLTALIGTKDELGLKNRELREKLAALMREIGVSNDHEQQLRSIFNRGINLAPWSQGNLAAVANASKSGLSANIEDDTLPYLRQDLSPSHRNGENCAIRAEDHGEIQAFDRLRDSSGQYSLSDVPPKGGAVQFLREQLIRAHGLCNEKLKVNAELSGTIKELKHDVNHLQEGKKELESALSALQSTHRDFISGLACFIGIDESAVAIEDWARSAVHKVADLTRKAVLYKDQGEALSGKITFLVAQKRVLSHIINIYRSKYKLDIFATPQSESTPVGRRLRSRIFAIVALQKISRGAKGTAAKTASRWGARDDYDVPKMARIGRKIENAVSLEAAAVAVDVVPRLERAVVEKTVEIRNLKDCLAKLDRSLTAVKESNMAPLPPIHSSFQYKEDMANRKNDMARRLQVVIQEKEDLDRLLEKEKQDRISAEARSTRYVDKLSLMKRKLGKVVSRADSKERTYKAAIIYLKNKAEKANNSTYDKDENVDPRLGPNPSTRSADVTSTKYRDRDEARQVLERELRDAQSQLPKVAVGSQEHEKISRLVEGLYGGIQRLEKAAHGGKSEISQRREERSLAIP